MGRSVLALTALALLCAISVAALTALGIWQLERRVWKLHLIDEVSERAHAAPIVAPGPSQWPQAAAGDYTYRAVRVAGQYLNDRETLVSAVTRLGGGFWVLTPLRTAEGYTILVNRGFVPPEKRDRATRAEGLIGDRAIVTGLLRLSEPRGAFLHANDVAADRWYSRDVAAIAAARDLSAVAPYFIDADASPVRGGLPIGGLTVTDLPNNHLVYALTWFCLAILLTGGLLHVGHQEWRLRHRGNP